MKEIEELVAMMPDDRVLLYKNVDSNPIGDLHRYSVHIRIHHLLTFTTFLLLAFTGMPIHYNTAFWAEPFNMLLGGIEVTRVIHRTLAVVMVFSMLYHILTLVADTLVKLQQKTFELGRTIIPTLKDIRDFKEDMLYFSGKRTMRPEMDKFMYKQKIHYFAAAFGNSVMVLSGSSFLFPEMWASILPASVASHWQEMMRLSHPHEALLALLVIAFWHWYNVHLAPGRFPMQWTFLTGKITREHQIEEHFLEYLRCLVEYPAERRYLRNLLTSKKLVAQPAAPKVSEEQLEELRA
ncbi:cytochrome b/b6 domain-containing protein [Noviherbaspirillum denitrificans]|uniref:cytochrome b/b6 domain-containing protein n=1 Tax=Noviherbaspirillum denitrificans TaxID=1968433 RepID=UPI0014829586|nr:cytochrome b/b6 domain-containing protein [Noviherbaspirillum denitrificans]